MRCCFTVFSILGRTVNQLGFVLKAKLALLLMWNVPARLNDQPTSIAACHPWSLAACIHVGRMIWVI
jgi:hypothetical protein